MRIEVIGAVPSIGATFGPATNITAVTNASEAVLTFASGHGITVGKWFQIDESGWPEMANRVFRASAVSTNDITAEDFDTSDTTRFPAGAAAGSSGKLVNLVSLQQINRDSVNIEGGEQQYETGQYINNPLSHEMATNLTPIRGVMTFDDDQSMSQWTSIKTAKQSGDNYPLILAYANGKGYWAATGRWSISAAPSFNAPVLRRVVTVAFAGLPTEYAT